MTQVKVSVGFVTVIVCLVNESVSVGFESVGIEIEGVSVGLVKVKVRTEWVSVGLVNVKVSVGVVAGGLGSVTVSVGLWILMEGILMEIAGAGTAAA